MSFSLLPQSLKEDLSQSDFGESTSVPSNFFGPLSTVVLGESWGVRGLRGFFVMGLRLGSGQLASSLLRQRARISRLN